MTPTRTYPFSADESVLPILSGPGKHDIPFTIISHETVELEIMGIGKIKVRLDGCQTAPAVNLPHTIREKLEKQQPRKEIHHAGWVIYGYLDKEQDNGARHLDIPNKLGIFEGYEKYHVGGVKTIVDLWNGAFIAIYNPNSRIGAFCPLLSDNNELLTTPIAFPGLTEVIRNKIISQCFRQPLPVTASGEKDNGSIVARLGLANLSQERRLAAIKKFLYPRTDNCTLALIDFMQEKPAELPSSFTACLELTPEEKLAVVIKYVAMSKIGTPYERKCLIWMLHETNNLTTPVHTFFEGSKEFAEGIRKMIDDFHCVDPQTKSDLWSLLRELNNMQMECLSVSATVADDRERGLPITWYGEIIFSHNRNTPDPTSTQIIVAKNDDTTWIHINCIQIEQ